MRVTKALLQPRVAAHGKIQPRSFGRFDRLVPSSLRRSSVPLSSSPYPPFSSNIEQPPYASTGELPANLGPDIPILTDSKDVAAIRRSCQLAANVLRLGGSLVRPGITTDEIDRRLFNDIVKNGAYPSPLNYMGFSRAICTSVNNVIAHGIPDSRPLVEGDIINLDITVYREGFHGDTSCTFYVGGKDAVDEPGIKLVETTREALDAAISICGPQVPFREIGRVISQIARVNGYSVSEQLTGHGIGRNFHQAPLVFHHRNEEPEIMAPGMCFTIEPILCQGTAEGIQWPDGWTIATMDHGRSAQFEHTVLITEDGCEILTLPK